MRQEATGTEFDGFSPDHAATLAATHGGPRWREAQESGQVERARRRMVTPPETANVFALPVEQLTAINEHRTRRLIAAGERDEERLLEALGTWPAQWPQRVRVRLSFLGINLGFSCDMRPRCVYCNQRPVQERMRFSDWQRVIASLTPADGKGTYVFITGGEPLLWREKLWGERGLIRLAQRAGAACNINTNALKLTPRAALGLVSSGTSRVHISLDSRHAEIQDLIYSRPGRWEQVLEGIRNLQVAKALLGVQHPVIHVNCVLTRFNADDFPGFLSFLLGLKPLMEGALSRDFDLHLIPVGGEQNQAIRLGAAEYEHFYKHTWETADRVYREYAESRAVPEDKRGALHEKMPFLSPYHRVQQRGDLAAWAQTAGAGLPAGLALCRRCYVAPTQGFVLPDGAQYWCGGHAVTRPEPVGNVLEGSVQDNIRRGLGQMSALPGEFCRGCPGATQAINQTVEGRLRETIHKWLGATADQPKRPQVAPVFE
jgi:MoaA/NifB/PqqE/SkfB family radical SAM enzyme